MIEQREDEDRKTYLVRVAIGYIKSHSGFFGMDDEILYDEAVCDGYSLANDLEIEFDIDTEDT